MVQFFIHRQTEFPRIAYDNVVKPKHVFFFSSRTSFVALTTYFYLFPQACQYGKAYSLFIAYHLVSFFSLSLRKTINHVPKLFRE